MATRLEELAIEQRISRVEIIREEKEILLLNELVKCKDKRKAIKKRCKPRDYFDLWYLAQKLDKK